MKAFNNYNEAKKAAQYSGTKRLPVGAYVCKVLGVKYQENEGFSDVIILQYDIAEGEQKDFFKNQYEANTAEDKKYKGIVRIYIPSDDGSERDSWTKNSFARWVNAFELSNPGYVWDWDENKWKGKSVGIVFGETGTVINGKEVLYTEARSACPVEDVRSDSYYPAKFKAKNGYTGTQKNSSVSADKDGFVIPDLDDEAIPF